MAMNRSEYWRNRNYPQRGTVVNIILKDIDDISPETLVYIGEKDGSGYKWIGLFGDVPRILRDKRVQERYPRTVGYKGEVLLLETIPQKKKGGISGKFWNWEECDKNVIPFESNFNVSPEAAEALMMAVMKDAALEYKNHLNKALVAIHSTSEPTLRKAVKKVRLLDRNTIDILSGTSRGEYILQRLEDEAIIKKVTPNWEKISYEKRQRILQREVSRMQRERVKEQESERYAHIKGRSVKR